MELKYCTDRHGQKYRFVKESDGQYFVYAPRKRKYGWRYADETFHRLFNEVAIDKTEKWHRRLRKCIRSMEKYDLWPELKRIYENQLNMTWEDHVRLQRGLPEAMDLINKYPFAFFKDQNGNTQVIFNYRAELSDCIIKSMYFGTWNRSIKDDISRALENKYEYNSGKVEVNYDVSFSYDGINQALYREEYKGCANGHYYLAVGNSMAVVYEDD
ncbi:MAG: hypothetical protein K5744_09220 [Eubacterium sp.]|nr:hypothetical protein [Eubacterium sp.]